MKRKKSLKTDKEQKKCQESDKNTKKMRKKGDGHTGDQKDVKNDQNSSTIQKSKNRH